MRTETDFAASGRAPVAIILGTNDIASAVGHMLHHHGYGVVLSRDPSQPVLRRGMSFDDALISGSIRLEDLEARRVESLVEIMLSFHDRLHVSVTNMDLGDLICLGLIDVLVDARMRMRVTKVDLRPFARIAIGLGPGFVAGRHVDAAVETAPEAVGRVVRVGATLDAHGRSALLGGVGRQRFARAEAEGRWHTSAALGDAVRRGDVVGFCGDTAILAPIVGRIRGLIRDDTDVAAGMKLVEVDPRGDDEACWTGIGERQRIIAQGTIEAIRLVEGLHSDPSPAETSRVCVTH